MKTLIKQEIKHYVIINLSYSLTHKALKEKIYSQIVKNLVDELLDIQKWNLHKILPINEYINDINKKDKLYYLIGSFTSWHTPEGDSYWNKLFKKYYNENY